MEPEKREVLVSIFRRSEGFSYLMDSDGNVFKTTTPLFKEIGEEFPMRLTDLTKVY
jgi:hypothetical protein